MVEVFKRAFRRANLKVAYSQGFHPQPRLSFLTALPLGLESDQEIMVATLEEYLAPAAAQGRLRLPEGLAVKRARILPPGGPKPKVASISYQIVSDTDLFIGKPLHPAALLRYTDNKGRLREYSLASFVESISAPTPRRLLLALKLGESGSPKPLAAVQALYGLTEAATLTIRKLATNLA
jgi:radical SAM-linked protein